MRIKQNPLQGLVNFQFSIFNFSLLKIALVLLIVSCQYQQQHTLTGSALGTSWKVTISARQLPADLQQQIADTIEQLEQILSTYRETSELSVVNSSAVATKLPISQHLYTVLAQAQTISNLSAGYFNVAIADTISDWGFGATGKSLIKTSKTSVSNSWQQFQLSHSEQRQQQYSIIKTADIKLDLSAIAKGYIVDQVAKLLQAQGYESFLIDIGGELVAKGKKTNNKPWLIAVENGEIGETRVAASIALQDQAIATSGNYRNYIMKNGKQVGHIFDGQTAKPSSNTAIVASVIADNCMLADALATTLMAMPITKAINFANDNDLSYMLIYKQNNQTAVKYSTKFKNNIK